MGGVKIAYGAEVEDLIVHIYGKGSNIYSAMLNGESVSGLIKSEIKSKAKGKGGAYRIKDKKKLLVLVKEVEAKFKGFVDGVEI